MKGDYEGNLIPDTFVPFIGIRVWKAKFNRENNLRLSSVYKDTLWPVNRKKIARCIEPFPHWIMSDDGIWSLQEVPMHPTDAIPNDDCSCGIYAVNSSDFSDNLSPWPDSTYTGLVFVWGRVLEGDKGFRGQFARPAALLREKDKHSMIQKLAKIYDVPVVDDLDAALQWQREAQAKLKPIV